MMGRPWQKCKTSEIHYIVQSARVCISQERTGPLYLLLDVVKRVGRVDGKTDKDNVRIGIGEGTETVIIFLASRIPQGQLNVLAIDLDVGDIVLENGGDVDLECTLAYEAWGCECAPRFSAVNQRRLYRSAGCNMFSGSGD